MQQYFSHICHGTDVQADWRRSCTYGRARNAIGHFAGFLYVPILTLIYRYSNFSSGFSFQRDYAPRTMNFKRKLKKKTKGWKFYIVMVVVSWLFNVTINDISVIYVTAHRCAGGLKEKLDLRSGSQRHRHFVGFFNVPVPAPTRDHPFYTVIPTHRPN